MNNQQKKQLIQDQIALYPSLTNDELYVKLKVKDIAVKVDLATRKLELYLVGKGLWLAFKNSPEAAVEAARDGLIMFDPVIDIKNQHALFEAMIQGLVDDSTFPFNAANQTDVLAMTNGLESWADQKLSDLNMGDIERARV